MGLRHAAVVAGLALGLMSGTARAAVVIDVLQVGPDVDAVGRGSLDLTGLSPVSTSYAQNGVNPANGFLVISTAQDERQSYEAISGPSSFGSLQAFEQGGDLSGSVVVGVDSATHLLYVPYGYVSGSDLGIFSSYFPNSTFQSLGLIQGTYTFKIPDDTLTINIGVSAVPLPSSAPMFGAALIAFGAVGYGLKRKRAAAA